MRQSVLADTSTKFIGKGYNEYEGLAHLFLTTSTDCSCLEIFIQHIHRIYVFHNVTSLVALRGSKKGCHKVKGSKPCEPETQHVLLSKNTSRTQECGPNVSCTGILVKGDRTF